MGGVMIPLMKREGYGADYAVNVTTHASLTGALMPTSHNMIIYAFAAQAAAGEIYVPAFSTWLPGLITGHLVF
jgi:TRAP-type C4-dicarboxylate transport system permease large subunit